jgi:hypothetical protein
MLQQLNIAAISNIKTTISNNWTTTYNITNMQYLISPSKALLNLLNYIASLATFNIPNEWDDIQSHKSLICRVSRIRNRCHHNHCRGRSSTSSQHPPRSLLDVLSNYHKKMFDAPRWRLEPCRFWWALSHFDQCDLKLSHMICVLVDWVCWFRCFVPSVVNFSLAKKPAT